MQLRNGRPARQVAPKAASDFTLRFYKQATQPRVSKFQTMSLKSSVRPNDQRCRVTINGYTCRSTVAVASNLHRGQPVAGEKVHFGNLQNDEWTVDS